MAIALTFSSTLENLWTIDPVYFLHDHNWVEDGMSGIVEKLKSSQ